MSPNRLLFLFDICGFNTQTNNSFNVTYLIICVHILMAVSFTIYEFCFFYKFYEYYGLFETINESIEYSASLCSYWLIIFDSIFYRRTHKRFWRVFQQINRKERNVIPRSYMIKFVEFFGSKFIIDFIVVRYYGFGDYDVFPALWGYIAYMIPINICQIRLFNYIFYLEVVVFQLKMIENELESMTMRVHYDRTIKPFQWIRNLECVHELSQLINKIFGLSNVSTILFCFYAMFTDLNYYYIHFHEHSTTRLMRKQSLVFFPILYPDKILFNSFSQWEFYG